jgi:putative ABC transport system ATP-binding protein
MNDLDYGPATSTTAYLPSAAALEQTVAIRIRKLQHYFGEGDLRKQVLFDNSLTVMQGEIVIMTGPSGSGKTTLLTLIGTLRGVQDGSLQLFGKELLGATSDELLEHRRNMGFIFQAHNLFESLSATQNVCMGLELFDYPRNEIKSRAVEMLEKVGLGHRVNYKPGALSGGQKQRVAIARGLAHSPRLILADEPTAALDEKSGRDVVTLFQQLAREENCTIVMVTHDNRILDVADRIISMVDGRIKSNVLVKESALVCEFLAKCSVFGDLTPRTLSEAADKMTAENYAAGQTIVRKGDAGDKFYLLRHGEVDVIADDRKVVATLGEGDFFGETALITGEPRNASVVAKSDAVAYALGKDDFDAVLASSASFAEELRKAVFERQ